MTSLVQIQYGHEAMLDSVIWEDGFHDTQTPVSLVISFEL